MFVSHENNHFVLIGAILFHLFYEKESMEVRESCVRDAEQTKEFLEEDQMHKSHEISLEIFKEVDHTKHAEFQTNNKQVRIQTTKSEIKKQRNENAKDEQIIKPFKQEELNEDLVPLAEKVVVTTTAALIIAEDWEEDYDESWDQGW